jgi:hypothetical protein
LPHPLSGVEAELGIGVQVVLELPESATSASLLLWCPDVGRGLVLAAIRADGAVGADHPGTLGRCSSSITKIDQTSR